MMNCCRSLAKSSRKIQIFILYGIFVRKSSSSSKSKGNTACLLRSLQMYHNVCFNRPEELGNYVTKELMLTEQCIKVNPKSYNSWFHRSWILDQGSNIDYQAELLLCDKCLELDERNCMKACLTYCIYSLLANKYLFWCLKFTAGTTGG